MSATTVYDHTGRAVYDSQKELVRAWQERKFPTHTDGVLRTGTANLEGYHYDDGSGMLKHYSHLEAIRTKSGLVIGDTSCYARGYAKCTKPQCDEKFDLTSLRDVLRETDLTIYEITSYDDGLVVFEGGEEYDMNDDRWY